MHSQDACTPFQDKHLLKTLMATSPLPLEGIQDQAGKAHHLQSQG